MSREIWTMIQQIGCIPSLIIGVISSLIATMIVSIYSSAIAQLLDISISILGTTVSLRFVVFIFGMITILFALFYYWGYRGGKRDIGKVDNKSPIVHSLLPPYYNFDDGETEESKTKAQHQMEVINAVADMQNRKITPLSLAHFVVKKLNNGEITKDIGENALEGTQFQLKKVNGGYTYDKKSEED